MSTRYADEGSRFRQERFASSAEYERGLMANLVVKRTAALRNAEDRELVWALQFLSHEEGGFQMVSDDLVRLFPERVASPSMQKFGTKPGQIYTAEQVRVVRKEITELSAIYERGEAPLCGAEKLFPLYGEHVSTKETRLAEQAERARHFREDEISDVSRPWESWESSVKKLHKSISEQHPKSYAAAAFVELCQARIGELPNLLTLICLDPDIDMSEFTPYFFPTLIQTLRDYVQHWIEEKTKGVVMTEIGRIVSEVCDYTAEQRIMSLIDGMARTGKTFQAKVWCAQNPGTARYVQVPSSNDEVGFYRAIARAIGVSINLNSKAHHLRDRIEDVLQSGQLTVVLDEAHFCWPTSNYRGALPRRISWICTALVNHGVPVVLVSTPQFFLARSGTVEKAHFNTDQFDGRLSHYEALPDRLSKEDLAAVAKSLLPEGSEATISGLVGYAQASAKYLAGISAVVTRSRFLAKRDGRTTVQAGDVRKAIKEGVIPSDKALAKAVKQADEKTRPKRGPRAVTLSVDDSEAESLQDYRSDAADAPQSAGRSTNFTGKPVAASNETTSRLGNLALVSEDA